MLNIITLMENMPSEHKALINKHGLSFLIQYHGHRLLFDCGSDKSFLDNAHRLGVSLKDLDGVILSHNHYDHASGFRDFIEQGFTCKKLYLGPDFFEDKLASDDGMHFTNLSSGLNKEFLTEHNISADFCTDVTQITDDIRVVGNFPRTHSFETIPTRFVRKTSHGFISDDFHDEIALVLETPKGLVVIVGCSHPGILNMVSSIHSRFRKPIYAIFGGTHLVEADRVRIEASLQEMKDIGVELYGLCHCSGSEAETCIRQNPTFKGSHLAVGDEIYIE